MIIAEHVNINHAPLKIDLDNATIYFDNIENIDPNSLTINKKHTENTNTVSYEIRHIRELDNIYQKIPFCLRFTDADAHFIEENGNKYLVFALTENNKEVLEPCKNIWSEIKKQFKKIDNSKSIKY